MIKRVKVKAKEGRVVRESPHGDFIPEDRFVSVPLTPYMERIINVHEDVEVEPVKATKPAKKPDPVPEAEPMGEPAPVPPAKTSKEEK